MSQKKKKNKKNKKLSTTAQSLVEKVGEEGLPTGKVANVQCKWPDIYK